MKRIKIIGVLKEHKAGVAVTDLCRRHRISRLVRMEPKTFRYASQRLDDTEIRQRLRALRLGGGGPAIGGCVSCWHGKASR